ncbi:MAG: hypothetical protein ACJKTH_00060 [Patescibacteria group bacterium UBA2163]
MKIQLAGSAVKQFKAFPKQVQKKTRKQFGYLLEDFHHPSLNAKKYKGYEGVWQARIDKQWRFYFHIVEPHYVVVSIITHP